MKLNNTRVLMYIAVVLVFIALVLQKFVASAPLALVICCDISAIALVVIHFVATYVKTRNSNK